MKDLIEKLERLKGKGLLLKRIPRQSRNIVIDECIAVVRQHKAEQQKEDREGE